MYLERGRERNEFGCGEKEHKSQHIAPIRLCKAPVQERDRFMKHRICFGFGGGGSVWSQGQVTWE